MSKKDTRIGRNTVITGITKLPNLSHRGYNTSNQPRLGNRHTSGGVYGQRGVLKLARRETEMLYIITNFKTDFNTTHAICLMIKEV